MRNTAILMLSLYAGLAKADWQLNMTEGATEVASQVYSLHMLVFYVCVAIGLLVFGVMFYALFKHRKSKGAKAANFHESTVVEVIWTAIPALILVVLAVPATKTLASMYDSSKSDITVMITGHQWKWQYRYLDDSATYPVDFFSNLSTPMEQVSNTLTKGEHYLLEVDRPLVLPEGKKIRFLFTSNDVIHSWWVPDLAVKKDAVPGLVTEAWAIAEETGLFRGQCAELCGKDHGFMPIVVDVRSEQEYQAWYQQALVEQIKANERQASQMAMPELMEQGEALYKTHCAACHQPNGQGIAGAFPSLVTSAVQQDRDQHLRIVVQGVANTGMSAFGPTLNDFEIAAIVTYERNAWGLNSGDRIDNQDVSRIREERP